jgi:hypothetical protein
LRSPPRAVQRAKTIKGCVIFQSTKLDRKGLFLLHAGHVLTYMMRGQSTVYAIQWTLIGPEELMTLRSQGDVNY